MKKKPKIVSVVGLTASGKSGIGIKLAQQFNGEIVSCDSRQVYRGLDLGSGKVTRAEQALVKHHLLDVTDPGDAYFNVADFQLMAYAAIDDILKRGKLPILVGGSGLYSRSIVEGYSFSMQNAECRMQNDLEKLSIKELQEMAKQKGLGLNGSDFNNKRRLIRKISGNLELGTNQNAPRFDVLQICLMPERDAIEKLVVDRLDARIADGMIDETRNLIASGVSADFLQSLGLEYFWNVELIENRITLDEYKINLALKIMQFVKRQRTWFKKEQNTIFLTEPKTFLNDCRDLIEKFIK